jgi:rhodanese-related sulfurtransferase
MNQPVNNLAIFFISIVLTLLFGATTVPAAPEYKNIMSVDAKKMMEQKKNMYLLDVRTPQEYAQSRMKGSVLIPINELERRVQEVPKNRPILVLCAVGSRSNLAAGFLIKKGYSDVYNLTDGLSGWYQHGFALDMQR